MSKRKSSSGLDSVERP